MTSWRRITLLAKVADESRPVWRKSKCNFLENRPNQDVAVHIFEIIQKE
jgi:hypothetical protein